MAGQHGDQMTRRRGVGSKETSSRLALFLSIFVGLTIGTGCSLIKIETPNEPIPTNEINVRLSTNAFAVRFAETVEFAADTILAQTTDLEIQLNALRWKINAFRAVRQASFHQAPVEALVDTWVLTTQMANFFQSGLGHDMFGTWQGLVVAQCDELQSDAANRNRI